MDVHYDLSGMAIVWDVKKTLANPGKHDGVTFERAASVFFDPFFRLLAAGRKDEERDAIIGFDTSGRLLLVVHVEMDGHCIRIVSARRATKEERQSHEHS